MRRKNNNDIEKWVSMGNDYVNKGEHLQAGNAYNQAAQISRDPELWHLTALERKYSGHKKEEAFAWNEVALLTKDNKYWFLAAVKYEQSGCNKSSAYAWVCLAKETQFRLAWIFAKKQYQNANIKKSVHFVRRELAKLEADLNENDTLINDSKYWLFSALVCEQFNEYKLSAFSWINFSKITQCLTGWIHAKENFLKETRLNRSIAYTETQMEEINKKEKRLNKAIAYTEAQIEEINKKEKEIKKLPKKSLEKNNFLLFKNPNFSDLVSKKNNPIERPRPNYNCSTKIPCGTIAS